MTYSGPERRKKKRMPPPTRSEVAMRLLLTTERLERLAARLEAYVDTPVRRTPRKKTT